MKPSSMSSCSKLAAIAFNPALKGGVCWLCRLLHRALAGHQSTSYACRHEYCFAKAVERANIFLLVCCKARHALSHWHTPSVFEALLTELDQRARTEMSRFDVDIDVDVEKSCKVPVVAYGGYWAVQHARPLASLFKVKPLDHELKGSKACQSGCEGCSHQLHFSATLPRQRSRGPEEVCSLHRSSEMP